MSISESQIHSWAQDYASKTPREILDLALDHYPNSAISFSGAEDVVLIHMAAQLKKPFRVFTLDTGRLHIETYEFLEKVRIHFNIEIEVTFPEAQAISEFTQKKGLFSFYQEGHNECCGIRKVAPLRKKLATLDAWITGQRKDQSPNTRQEVPVVQKDAGFSTAEHPLVKFTCKA